MSAHHKCMSEHTRTHIASVTAVKAAAAVVESWINEWMRKEYVQGCSSASEAIERK